MAKERTTERPVAALAGAGKKGFVPKGLRCDSLNNYMVSGAGEMAWQHSVFSAPLEVPAPTLGRTHNLLEL